MGSYEVMAPTTANNELEADRPLQTPEFFVLRKEFGIARPRSPRGIGDHNSHLPNSLFACRRFSVHYELL